MLKVKKDGNRLVVVTPIKAEAAAKNFTALEVTDEKGHTPYSVLVDNSGVNGRVQKCGLTCNTVVDGYLAVSIMLPMDATMDQVKKDYGVALVEGNKYIDQIATNVENEAKAVDAMFAETTAR